jgi:hypothetical protein
MAPKRYELSEKQWARIRPLIADKAPNVVVPWPRFIT